MLHAKDRVARSGRPATVPDYAEWSDREIPLIVGSASARRCLLRVIRYSALRFLPGDRGKKRVHDGEPQSCRLRPCLFSKLQTSTRGSQEEFELAPNAPSGEARKHYGCEASEAVIR